MRSLIAIQEDQLSIETLKELEALLRAEYVAHIGPEKLTIIWNVTAKKHGITDRQWSRSSAVSIEVPNGLDKKSRERLLEKVEKNWRKITGQHPDHLSIAAFDADRFGDILKGNLARLSFSGRINFLIKLLVRILASKRRHGVMMANFNQ